jgi:hypothetical protein
MKETSRGFITLAFGSQFAEMAIDTALSFREFHTEPISVAVDLAAQRQLSRYKKTPFDRIILLPEKVHPFGARFLLADATPYEHTVAVDADILFLGPLPIRDHEFEAPLAMYGGYMSKDTDFQTYHSGKEMCKDFGLNRYFWGQGALFAFRKAEVREMFKECYGFYVSGIKKYPKYNRGTLADEMVFGIMGDKYPIDSIPCATMHPWPLPENLATVSPSDTQWPVFHMVESPNPAYLDFLMAGVNRRRRDAGLPLVSELFWRRKGDHYRSAWDKIKHLHRKFWRRLGIHWFG